MKNKKNAIAVLLALLLITVSAQPLSAEETQKYTNHLTAKWTADVFAGSLTETEIDGTAVTEYIPELAYSWFSPTLDIYSDIKALIGDRDGAAVVLSYEIQGIFENEGLSATGSALFRAVNPKTGALSFPPDQAGDWDGNGYSWTELFAEVADGDLKFYIENNNNYFRFNDADFEVNGTEWTRIETEPFYVSASDLNDTLFGGWLVCFDTLEYNANFKGLRIRNTAIYDYDEGRPTQAPTGEPTETPAVTDAPVPTDAPAQAGTASNAPAETTPGKTTDKPADNNTVTGKKPNAGLIIGIICGAAAVAAVAAVAVVKSRKKKS